MADKNTATARLLAVEMLLACPDTLNSALETELWLLRDQLIADEPKLGQHVPLRLSVRLAGTLLTGVGDFPVVQLLSRDRHKAWDRGAADHSDGSW